MTRVADRRARIQLLVARAQYERLLLRRSVCAALDGIRPEALADGAGRGLRVLGLGWLASVVQGMRRYPMLLSLASSLVASVASGAGRNRPAVGLGLLGLLAWRLLRLSARRS